MNIVKAGWAALIFFGCVVCRPAEGNLADAKGAREGAEEGHRPLPSDYETLSGCDKANYLWNDRVKTTAYRGALPAVPGTGIMTLAWSTLTRSLRTKMDLESDQAPSSWTKPIHRRGTVARVAFTAAAGQPYTGLFEGVPCGLLRMSLTSNPKGSEFNPGFAWKAFVDGHASRNVSALVSLDGQGANFNFLHNNFSNVVPPSDRISARAAKLAFESVSKHAHKIGVEEFASLGADGGRVALPAAPRQIVFVPDAAIRGKFPVASGRDFRDDLASLPSKTVLFRLYGLEAPVSEAEWNGLLRAGADQNPLPTGWRHVGDLTLASEFISSSWGDDGIFFRHERYNKE